MRIAALSVLVLCTMAACGPSGGPPTATGSPPVAGGVAVVTGGVAPCRGIPGSTDPRYAAATVTVLDGQVTSANAGPGVTAEVLPTEVAGRASVGVNGTYRFVLAPGRYVLVATFPPAQNVVKGPIQPSNAEPFTEITVRGGSAVHADIANVCL